jgi:ABC-type phosphate transport system substrate-binding protein
MKNIIVSFIVLFLSYTLTAEEYVVISNKSIKTVSKAQIKAIFLKKMSLVNDLKVVPVSLQARDILRKNFERSVLKMSFPRLKSYWTKQHYLGHRPPLSLKSQAGVKAFVKKVDGAIGYISRKNLDSDLNVLYSWED